MTQREIRKLVKRLRIGQPPRRAGRWSLMLLAGVVLLATGLLVWPQPEAVPAYQASRNSAEMTQQRARFAQELHACLTPLQRATLDRFEPVVIGDSGFTAEQRRRAWQLAQVGDGQFPPHAVTRITAVLERIPAADGIAPGDEVRCIVRMEFAFEESPVAYRAVASVPGY